MTTVAVLADPPEEGAVLSDLVAETPLSAAEATDLYLASLCDAVRSVAASEGELLVNFRAPGDRQEAAEAVRDVVEPALEDVDGADPRFEVQVGDSLSARAGNTVTHLLEEEEVNSAAVLRPTAPLVARTTVDQAAMKLRRSGVVLGPALGGDVYYAGFTDPVDFADAFASPAVETLTDRGRAADADVDFLSTVPTLETPSGLASTVALVRAKRTAGRPVPGYTAGVIDRLGLAVTDDGRSVTVVEA